MGVYKMIKLSFIWIVLFEHGFMQTIFLLKLLKLRPDLKFKLNSDQATMISNESELMSIYSNFGLMNSFTQNNVRNELFCWTSPVKNKFEFC